jgi:hypothetical protein
MRRWKNVKTVLTAFAEAKGEGVALACMVAGVTPGELFRLSKLERQLLIKSAQKLEEERWKRLSKLLGG